MKQRETDNRTDEELFALVSEKADQAAFSVVYKRYSRRVFAYCLRVLENREEAEDVFQTVIMNVYEKRDSFKGGSFVAWLMTITRNQCLMAKRSRKYTQDVMEMADVLDDVNDRTGHDFTLDEALMDAVERLQPEFKEIIQLKYFDDFAYEHIAEILGISLSLVKVRLFRAKKALYEMLTPYREDLK